MTSKKASLFKNFSSPSNLQTIFPVTGHAFRLRFRAGVFLAPSFSASNGTDYLKEGYSWAVLIVTCDCMDSLV